MTASASEPRTIVNKDDAMLLLIDHEPAMFFGVASAQPASIVNAVAILAKAAKAYALPTVLTTINADGFSGPLIPEITDTLPRLEPIDRTTINSWEDARVRSAVLAAGRRQIVAAGLWTEACLMQPVLSMLEEGLEVYIVTDASGGSSPEAHMMAVQRMIQAGARPATALSVLFELQRDFARTDTVGAMVQIAKTHGGGYGQTLRYAEAMLPSSK